MSGVVLVTGGAGYIGSHVSKALAEWGLSPVCYDTLEKGHAWAVRWGPLECGDIGSADRLEEVFTRHKPRAIVHLAGYIEVGESMSQPERYLHNNVAKSEVLIEAAVRHGVEAFVFSSSCAVYGMPQTDQLDETHRIAPLSPYAESKARVEASLTRAACLGLRTASLRYFNAAGADAGGEIGEAHEPETHLLPLAVDAALRLGPPLTLLGADYPTPDGSCVRGFHPCQRPGRRAPPRLAVAATWIGERAARAIQPGKWFRLQCAPGPRGDGTNCGRPGAA